MLRTEVQSQSTFEIFEYSHIFSHLINKMFVLFFLISLFFSSVPVLFVQIL